jgi:6-phosphogluconate dehydrogenase
MLGLGRMGANMVRRLMKNGHECVVFDQDADVVKQLADEGAVGASDMDDFISKLAPPRPVWMMVPAAVVDSVIEDLSSRMSPGDILIDAGNSFYKDDIARAKQLATSNFHYVDVGTSGGVWGLERGYCLMIGGEKDIVEHLDPVFKTIAPGMGDIDRTTGRDGDPSASELGYLHCGPNGAGHFVKMVHNGIEYGIMAAYAGRVSIYSSMPTWAASSMISMQKPPRCRIPKTISMTSTWPRLPRSGAAAVSWRPGSWT